MAAFTLPFLIVPIFVIIIFVFAIMQMKWIKALNKWGDILKRKDATQVEAEEALLALEGIRWVPNHPDYWGRCKQIYYGIVNSKEVSYETKMEAFERFDKLKVRGIRAPKKHK